MSGPLNQVGPVLRPMWGNVSSPLKLQPPVYYVYVYKSLRRRCIPAACTEQGVGCWGGGSKRWTEWRAAAVCLCVSVRWLYDEYFLASRKEFASFFLGVIAILFLTEILKAILRRFFFAIGSPFSSYVKAVLFSFLSTKEHLTDDIYMFSCIQTGHREISPLRFKMLYNWWKKSLTNNLHAPLKINK